jgi:hypothetical protein
VAHSKDSPAAPTVAGAAPLLLLPLLVLPDEAAAEMQQAWQAAALAAGKSITDAAAPHSATRSSVTAAVAAAWAGAVSSLTVDIAYVLSACSAASAGGSLAVAPARNGLTSSAVERQASPLPAGVSAVLCNLLQHLAAAGLFHTMKFIVDVATAATTGAAAATNSSSTASSKDSTTRLCCSCTELEPFAEEGPGANAAGRDPVEHRAACSSAMHGSPGWRHAAPDTTATGVAATYAEPSLLQLLCGFSNPGLESRYLAATFNSSATLDLFTAVYNVAMGVGCWFAAGGKLHSLTSPQQQQQYEASAKFVSYQAAAAAAWLGGWSGRLVWSVVMVFLLHMGSSLAVGLLRVRTYVKLQQMRKQQQQQQSMGSDGAACSSDAEQRFAAGGSADQAAAAVCSEAGFARQWLLALCVLQISLLNVMCATGAGIAPIMIVRAWGLHSWAQDAAMTLVLVVKAWMYQVRAGR